MNQHAFIETVRISFRVWVQSQESAAIISFPSREKAQ